MSDDLISRKALIEEIQSFRCYITGLRNGKGVLAHAADEYRKSILQIIDEQPTVFDKEKVIKKLKHLENDTFNYYNRYDDEVAFGESSAFRSAIEIIEKGGIE